MSDDTEVAIGREIDAKIKKKYGVFENPQIQKYVEHVGLKLVSVSDRQDMVYHFAILNTNNIDSVAVCGGYVYLTKGLLSRIEDEAILAAAIASEIVHIARRHNIEEIDRQIKVEANRKRMTKKSDILQLGANIAYNFTKSGFGKKLQTEADIKGTEYLLRAGYDTEAIIKLFDMFQVEEKRQPQLVADLLKTHSKTTKRIDDVRLMRYNLKLVEPNKYNSTSGNYYPERYRENVLDVFKAKTTQ